VWLEYRGAPYVKKSKGSKELSIDDFFAYMPQHGFIFAPTRDLWPASNVNARVRPIPRFTKDGTPIMEKDKDGNETGRQKTVEASTWLMHNRPVEKMTWAPGMPMLVEKQLIFEGGWIPHEQLSTFNLYRPPMIELGDASKARALDQALGKTLPC
jgi:hypothetical protein